jgi:hypothetical protein
MTLPRLAGWVLALGLAGAGCGATSAPGETLLESARTYNDGLRWQRFSAAAARLPAAERTAFVDDWDQRSTDLKITDYDIVRVTPVGARRARVQVKLAWYRDSEGTLRETHALQTWEQRGKAWFLVETHRLRGVEMPGLTEPLAGAPLTGATGATGAGAKRDEPDLGDQPTVGDGRPGRASRGGPEGVAAPATAARLP